jgi:hypothetical protein
VAELDGRIQAVLVERLRSIIELWCQKFADDAENESPREARLREKAKEAKVCVILPLKRMPVDVFFFPSNGREMKASY